MLDVIEKAFAPELLAISPKAANIVDFAWTLYNIGGTVPIRLMNEQFHDAENLVAILSKAGVLRYSLGGFITKNSRKESISVSVNEEVLVQLPKGSRRNDFENLIYRRFGESLVTSSRTTLSETLAVMLTSVVFYANPNKPVFVNSVIRKAAKISMKSQVECKNILDYYLSRYLGLVTNETGSLINLSVRSKQRVRQYPKIWETYIREYKEKPKESAPVPVEKKASSPEVSEQEKKLKGYFPWMKL